jgi:hypothetical protein
VIKRKGDETKVRSRSLLAAMLAVLLLAGTATAAAPTRDEYVDQLETICKPSGEATQRAMQGGRADIRAERFQVAAGKFAAAAGIFAGSLKKMGAVPRPPADTAKLAKWFGYLDTQEIYLREAAEQLRAENAVKAQRLTARFIHSGNLANNTVLAFGFQHCSFKFSRYG